MELYHFHYICDIVKSNTGSQLDRKESRSTTSVQLQCWIFGSESLKWEVENRITWSIVIYSSISMTHVSRYQRKIVLNVIAMVTGRESVIISLFLFPTSTGVTRHLSDSDICPTTTFVRHRVPKICDICPTATFVRQRHLSESDFTLYLILILSGEVQTILRHEFD